MTRSTTSSRTRRTQPKPAPKNRTSPGPGVLRRVFRVAAWILPGIVAVIFLLRFVPPPTSAFMLTRHVERLTGSASGPAVMYRWTSAQNIPGHMALAVVAAEDQNFPHHFGFDMDAITRAMEHNRQGSSIRGASTISQQVAKNLFLWSGRSYARKGLEAGLTVLIELMWPKQRILEVYLNIAEFGDGTYGVHAAARRFFEKTPDRLTVREAALLAAVLPSPRRSSATHPSAYVRQRAQWIQTQMRQLGPDHIEWRQ